jgi:hypothetical protein
MPLKPSTINVLNASGTLVLLWCETSIQMSNMVLLVNPRYMFVIVKLFFHCVFCSINLQWYSHHIRFFPYWYCTCIWPWMIASHIVKQSITLNEQHSVVSDIAIESKTINFHIVSRDKYCYTHSCEQSSIPFYRISTHPRH